MKKINTKTLLLLISLAIAVIAIGGVFIALRVKSQMKDLFAMNDELKAEGYYMGDFEFKMLSFAYDLDKGHFIKALTGIGRLHNELSTKTGLIKIPQFSSKEEEMDFYLNLQNPNTGAFIDDSYPYCTYNEVTENVLMHLDQLSFETGRPLQLKYPLKYLDNINTKEKLTAFLNDVSQVGWIANKFPQTSYVFARSLLSYCNGESVVEKNNLYTFSPEWKSALLQWFYDSQDPETGFFGPRSKNGEKLLRKDVNNTASIVKTFVDENGNDRYPQFPLKYKDKLFQNALDQLSLPLPEDSDLDEWHEWSLSMSKGTAMLTRYLWKDASQENKTQAEKLFLSFVQTNFAKHYVKAEGAFSYNPNTQNASLDGTGTIIGNLTDMGFFTPEKQRSLWGSPESTITDLGTKRVVGFLQSDFDAITNQKGINSLRIYLQEPSYSDLLANARAIVYPHKTEVPDALDLLSKVRRWANATSQTMGNWTSRETLLRDLEHLTQAEVTVYETEPFENVKAALEENTRIVLIGFDAMQVPRVKIVFELIACAG